MVFFEEGTEENALKPASVKDTQLLAYFKLNEIDPIAHNFLYSEIPYHCFS